MMTGLQLAVAQLREGGCGGSHGFNPSKPIASQPCSIPCISVDVMADFDKDPEGLQEPEDKAQGSGSVPQGENEEDSDGDEETSASESADDDLDQRNDDDLEEFSEESMDEAEQERRCTARTISANTGHRRQPHDIRGCRSVDNFKKLNMISEGSYGRVWRAQQQLRNGRVKINALKQVKMEKEKEGFPMTALREIHILLTLQHTNVVAVEEVVVGAKMDSIFLVMEYLPHDLKYLMETMRARFLQSEVKCLLVQLLKACCYMHDNWIIHRDLKTSNLLYSNNGVLKVSVSTQSPILRFCCVSLKVTAEFRRTAQPHDSPWDLCM